MLKKLCHSSNTISCKPSRDFLKTKPNLALSPAQCSQMADAGIPITSANNRDYFDGEISPSWNVPPERRRGVDVADLWQCQQTARSRIRRAFVNDREIYGNVSKPKE